MSTGPADEFPTTVAPRVELSVIDLDVPDAASVLTALAERAEAAGWVRPTFLAALLERERAYPTGLPTAIPVAIPHADVEHVIAPGLGIARLASPVDFGEMGAVDSVVAARFVVLILVSKPHEQVELLTTLIGVFQHDGWFDRISAATSVDELVTAFSDLLDDRAAAP